MGEVLVPTTGAAAAGGGRGVTDVPELMLRSEDKTIDGGGDGGSCGVGGDLPSTTTTTGSNNNFVRWEKFLPKMVLRVLLVEADDSTRQIITALLRKCSYKVAAVSDGLKAWEVLKGRSHNIDLILTEVELPSISGFALLTLIMEHQVCKNIPVIMMSAHDSVSTVYKCMLRGASDFLVKPVRKNELKNLWQHVWRRQSSTGGRNGNQEDSDAQQKVEATAENNATSNRSSGYIACVTRNRECIEKGSDAQSSCTKPDMEPDEPEPPMEQPMDHTGSEPANQLGTERSGPSEPEGNTAKGDTDTSGQGKNMAIDVRWEHVNVITSNNSREAIDLIGSFDSYPKTSFKSLLTFGETRVEHPSPLLDLSLRRPHPSSSVNQFSDDRHRLKQSDASAFSRYINKGQPLPLPPLPLPSAYANVSNQQNDYETHSAPVGNSQHITSQHRQTESQSQSQNQSQSQFPSPKERVFPVPLPVPVPVRGPIFENQCATYGSIVPPFCVQPMPSPSSSGYHEQSFQTNPYYIPNQEARNESQDMHNTTEALEDHSGNSSFCNGGTLTRLNSVGSGSNGNNNTHRSMQREAALNKFRMKRKDRCFDKKVRYESRKKLAEQRPRVKGQFVRQGQTSNPSTSPVETDTQRGTAKSTA